MECTSTTKSSGLFKTKTLFSSKRKYETKDDVHSTIEYCALIKVLLDTKPVQRLRSLSQLGTSMFTYINATHSRFEHSLGVAHLAGKLAECLKKDQPQLNITEKDVLCVKIAGLCHDLGHGPYSHVFDGPFQHRLSTENPGRREVEHEIMSTKLIDVILEELGLQIDISSNGKFLDEPLKQIGDGISNLHFGVDAAKYNEEHLMPKDSHLLTSRDLVFIKECIMGGKPVEEFKEQGLVGGRCENNKEFLYDIVSNSHNGLDVDKIDYYCRDGKKTVGECELKLRFIIHAVVARVESPYPNDHFHFRESKKKIMTDCDGNDTNVNLMITYPEKMVTNSIEFFKFRFNMFQHVYNHKKTNAVASMIVDILHEADKFMKIRNEGEGPDFVKISETFFYPKAFLELNDTIIDAIYYQSQFKPEMSKVRSMISNLKSHNCYKTIVDRNLCSDSVTESKIWSLSETQIKEKMIKLNGAHSLVTPKNVLDSASFAPRSPEKLKLRMDEFQVEKLYRHHGMKERNPVEEMRFVSDDDLEHLSKPVTDLPMALQMVEKRYTASLPQKFDEKTIRVLCKVTNKSKGCDDAEKKQDLIKHVFEQFWESLSSDEEDQDGEFALTAIDVSSPAGNRINNNYDDQNLVLLTQESIDDQDNDDFYGNLKQPGSSSKKKKRKLSSSQDEKKSDDSRSNYASMPKHFNFDNENS